MGSILQEYLHEGADGIILVVKDTGREEFT
jgi:hypothetical protein